MGLSLSDLPRHLQQQVKAQLPKAGRGIKPKQQDKADIFAAMWPADYPRPQREYVFAHPRRWRFDFAWPWLKVAVEVDGGQWSSFGGGRHNTDADREKMNTAAAMGWRVLRFSPKMLKDAGAVIALVSQALKHAG